jgi:hypothetical protein
MPAPTPHLKTIASDRPNRALCASAVSRLVFAAGALLLLWVTIHWALS